MLTITSFATPPFVFLFGQAALCSMGKKGKKRSRSDTPPARAIELIDTWQEDVEQALAAVALVAEDPTPSVVDAQENAPDGEIDRASRAAFGGNKFQRVCFTAHEDKEAEESNRPSPDVDSPKWKATVNFVVFQMERCPRTRRIHWQGYIEFKKQVRFAAIKDLLKCKCHLIKCLGDRLTNVTYCTKNDSAVMHPDTGGKEDLFVWPEDKLDHLETLSNATGQMDGPAPGGKLTQDEIAEAVKLALQEGKTEADIFREFTGFYFKHQLAVRAAAALVAKDLPKKIAPPRESVYVELLVGGTGLGKSDSITRRWPNHNIIWKRSTSQQWWEKVEKHSPNEETILVLDEFTGHRMMSVTDFLAATDVNHALFPVKYDSGLVADWKMVVITSNVPVDEWYPGQTATDAQREAVRSRISRVIRLTNSDPNLKLRANRLKKGAPLPITPEAAKPLHAQLKHGDLVFPWDTIPAYSEHEIVLDIAAFDRFVDPLHVPIVPAAVPAALDGEAATIHVPFIQDDDGAF